MTLNDIIIAALAQLDRGRDPQTVEAYAARFTGYANDAQADLARAIGFKRTDELEPEGGYLDLGRLPRAVVKVLGVERGGARVSFESGPATGLLKAEGEGAARVTYLCEPKDLELPADVSELPEICHKPIVSYVVARERMAGDASTQRGGNIYLSMYEAAKARLRTHVGEPESYRIENRY